MLRHVYGLAGGVTLAALGLIVCLGCQPAGRYPPRGTRSEAAAVPQPASIAKVNISFVIVPRCIVALPVPRATMAETILFASKVERTISPAAHTFRQ